MLHHKALTCSAALLLVDPHGCTKCGSRITRRRLYPDVFKRALISDPGIKYAVQCNTACHTKVFHFCCLMQPGAEFKNCFLEGQLQRTGYIEMMARKWVRSQSGWSKSVLQVFIAYGVLPVRPYANDIPEIA